mmetsp:Transcript_25916/g.59876  ORF Transcript_25916/g.59876 Transcript_25916/m.59876 type:complete len:201 (-) Transcript_25916:267-869(-)
MPDDKALQLRTISTLCYADAALNDRSLSCSWLSEESNSSIQDKLLYVGLLSCTNGNPSAFVQLVLVDVLHRSANCREVVRYHSDGWIQFQRNLCPSEGPASLLQLVPANFACKAAIPSERSHLVRYQLLEAFQSKHSKQVRLGSAARLFSVLNLQRYWLRVCLYSGQVPLQLQRLVLLLQLSYLLGVVTTSHFQRMKPLQ